MINATAEADTAATITVQEAATLLEVSYPRLLSFLSRKRDWFPKRYDENRQRVLSVHEVARVRDNIS